MFREPVSTNPEDNGDAWSFLNEDLADHPGPGRDVPDLCDFLHRAFAAGWTEEDTPEGARPLRSKTKDASKRDK